MRESKYARNKTLLHRRIGISRPALSRLFERGDYPPQVPGKGWDVEQWQRYADNNIATWNRRQPRNGSSPTLRDEAYIKRLELAVAREKFELEVRMGEFISRLQANREIDTANAIVIHEWNKMFENELPPQLDMVSPARAKAILCAARDRLLKLLPQKFIGNESNGHRRR